MIASRLICALSREMSEGGRVRRLILKSFQSPGDILMLTAAVRDLHLAHPGHFETDVRSSADGLWKNNPYLTVFSEGDNGVECIDMHYPLIQQSNQTPYHFIHGYIQYLEDQLDVRIPVSRFHGDIHLSLEEKESRPFTGTAGLPERFWLIVAGGKYDFTAKWWNPASFQAVVDHFRGSINFVQCGEKNHWHKPLKNVVNLVGKTSLREFVQLMYHADGVVCPVTFPMHLAAAVETKPGGPRHRPCVVIAGGREPSHWEAYPHHQFISLVGALPCCADGGCWKSRCQTVGDGDDKDHRNLCENPVQVAPDLRIPKCMDMISPEEVIRRIEFYYQGGVLERLTTGQGNGKGAALSKRNPTCDQSKTTILIQFGHGLGDALQLTSVLKHLNHYHPDWTIDVASYVGKHSAFHGLCRRSIILDRDRFTRSSYDDFYDLEWGECSTGFAESPSTKAEECLRNVFDVKPLAQLCGYSINQSEHVRKRARLYLARICQRDARADGRFPAVCIHYEGNTAAENKNLPVEVAKKLCELVKANGFIPVILDWDRRTPLADGKSIHNPDAKSDLWDGTGTGDAEILAALIDQSCLMIGVDSGPLHVAGAVSTPTIAVWTSHHPLHYFGLADNVIHLVPEQHSRMIRGDRPAAQRFFEKNYHSKTYKDLWECLSQTVKERLDAPVESVGKNGTNKPTNQTIPGLEPPASKEEPCPQKATVPFKRTDLPRLLITFPRSHPQNGSHVVLMDKGEIVLRHEHPRGVLRGLAKLAGKIWAIDSEGTLYQVQAGSSSIRVSKVAISDLGKNANDLNVVNGKLATGTPHGIVLYDPKTNRWSVRRPWVPNGILEQMSDKRATPRLNSVVHDGESYILSLTYASDRDPSSHVNDEGLIIRWSQRGFCEHSLASGKIFAQSLRLYQSQIWWCDSRNGKVCREDGWQSPSFGGETFGLAFHGNQGTVGLARSSEKSSGLCLFDLEDPKRFEVIELGWQFQDIGSIIPVSEEAK
jgi:ADP-heptose:LPS heptosyltransferase